MVDLGGLANYFNRVGGGSFDYFSPLELGISSLVGELPSFIDPTPFVSPFSYGLSAGVGIGRSFYGSLFSPTYEQSKWQAAGIIGTMGDAVFNTDRMIYGAQTATGGGAPFHFITPMPAPYIPVSAPSSPDPSIFDRPMQRYDPPAASPPPPSAQPPPAPDLAPALPSGVPPAKKGKVKKSAPPPKKTAEPKSIPATLLSDENSKKLAVELNGDEIYQISFKGKPVQLLVQGGQAFLIEMDSRTRAPSASRRVGTVKGNLFTPEK